MDLLRMAGDAWKEADKRLGGWLPGGGTASPITKAIFPAQPFPGRSRELERQTGVKGRFINPAKTPSVVSRVAPVVSPQWGTSNYANPVTREVGMPGYQGGATPEERRIEYHELGHLNSKDKAPYSYFGVGGRALQGISGKTGNLPPLDLAAGLALRYADAPEEDRAERFAARWAERGGYEAPYISPEGRSEYGDKLRQQGEELTSSAVERITNPFGLRTKVESFINTQRARPLQEELTRSLPAYRKSLIESGDQITPEMIAESKRLDNLQKQIEALGVKVDY
jgi:hypothetical protein